MSLTERLRSIVRPVNGPPAGRLREPCGDVAAILGGEWREQDGHRYLVVDRHYGPDHRHGRASLAEAMPAAEDAWSCLSLLLSAGPSAKAAGRARLAGRLLFFDLETTGLAGGAGTYAFLIGCGWFGPHSAADRDGAGFHVRQFFLSAFDAEPAMLSALMALARGSGALVSYNGKSFDLPLLENRFVLRRLAPALSDMPHIDLLHPARRFWRDERAEAAGESSCRLTALERTQCGFEREGDVPGFEIPSRYFEYVRSGDARPLAAVLEHNRLDLISLAILTARTAQMLEHGPAVARSGREALGLGRIYERGSLTADAWTAYAVAAGMKEWAGGGPPVDSTTRAEALRACALLSRRQRRFDAAAEAWQRLLQLPGCPGQLAREASEALAVHHEHRLRDAATARQFASQALLFPSTSARAQAAQHRLARLDRKLAVSS